MEERNKAEFKNRSTPILAIDFKTNMHRLFSGEKIILSTNSARKLTTGTQNGQSNNNKKDGWQMCTEKDVQHQCHQEYFHKTITKYHYMPIRIAKTKKTKLSIGDDVKKMEEVDFKNP